jgi:starch synthase (maltosyl-transferring)
VSPPARGRARVVIEHLSPQIDAGRFPVKRCVGDHFAVEVDAFTDGHDQIHCLLQSRAPGATEWCEVPMRALGNDRWRAGFALERLGVYAYRVLAWVDPFKTWRHDLQRREDAADIELALEIGAQLVEAVAAHAPGAQAAWLRRRAAELRGVEALGARREQALDAELLEVMLTLASREWASQSATLGVVVDPLRARYSAWYELFPRSAGPAGRHGTFKDVIARLPYVAELGFDVLYLPPIHPIGRVNRKGANNRLRADAADVGSPWAIGSEEGGHKAIHPALGTLEDFRTLVRTAEEDHGIAVALDVAFQCAPDHPYVKEHPEWFRKRPDGSVQYAENPPKKYQDIYPFDFECDDWQALWQELKSVFEYWIAQGVRIFRVDNPHTKPFPFWEWVIGELKARHPELIFLSEAFTRPKVMARLAKLGFTQSYTYFTWRNTAWELREYLEQLTGSELGEYFRPNFWPNTPDILHEYLQRGGRPAFGIRLVLAATLGASYGIYGPAFELLEHRPREAESEEYLDSEKYQLRHWELERADSLRHLIARINRIRRQHPALQRNGSLRFHPVDNPELLCFSKHDPDDGELVLTVVNLDPFHVQSGWVELPLDEFRLDAHIPYAVDDLLGGGHYLWHGERNFVQLDPQALAAHVFLIRSNLRTEQDFPNF